MERDGLKPEKLNERGRQQVLCRVLLHVIEAARPINTPVHRTHGDLGRGVMNHMVIRADHLPARIHDLNYGRLAQLAQIVRLASGGGVKCRLVQYDLPAIALRFAGHDLRVEFPQKSVAIIEPVRQVSSLSQETQDSMEEALQ